ncbi:MAG: hypothetical protein JWP87_1469 [Labilithrix sp.]|nr:hypothetical protein [Labilithrix sp.]
MTLAVASCASGAARTKPLGPPGALPEPRRAARFTVLPEWYWEPVEVDTRAAAKPVELPVPESSVVRVEGATRVWDDLGGEGRERLLRDGLVVNGAPDAARARMGAFYMDTREQRVPYVITLDALAYAVHVAFERALAEVDDAVLAPALHALTSKLDVRLAAEQKGAGVEIGEALRLARGIIAVARSLATDGAAVPSAELGPEVPQELARITAHRERVPSALLGVPMDYARFAVPSGAARPGSFRALAWLATAPLVLVAQSEAPGGSVGVATSRLHARAAMLLSRVVEREVDPEIHAAWSRISRLLTFLWGPSDDLAPGDLADIASAIGVTLEDPKHVANVVTIDRLRRRAARGREPLVYDGTGAPGRAGIAMRLFGGHAPADSVALAAMAAAHETRMPSSLDLAVWLGAPEARASLHDEGGDTFAGYDAALARAIAVRPGDDAPSRHASVYGSLLDVLMTWLEPAEDSPRQRASPAAKRAAIESALAAWTYARQTSPPLGRAKPPKASAAPKELKVTGAALPAFVEAAPDVVARMVATLAQMRRGLGAIAGLPPASPAMTTLAEVEDILRVAMRVASRTADDEAISAEDTAALASMPARFARLEEAAEGEGAAHRKVPLFAEVFVDASGEHVLFSAAGLVEPVVMIVREPSTGRLVVAVGAHVAHHEVVEPRGKAVVDGTTLPRGAYVSTFRIAAR